MIFPPITDSYGLIILIYLILNCYPHHIAITLILQCVLKQIVYTG